MRAVLLLLALWTTADPVAAQAERRSVGARVIDMPTLHLRALDTLNGTTTDLTLRVGETVTFGRLEITADTCRVPEADPKGEASAFLRIRDSREQANRFSGWMFASSPALSALDHPRYDVWVVSCSNR